MATQTVYMRQGDLLPVLNATLQDSSNVAVDLSAATAIAFHLRERNSATSVTLTGTAAFVSKPAGTVSYTWGSGDTDTAGTFYGEFEVTFSSGTETFPSKDELVIVLAKQLG